MKITKINGFGSFGHYVDDVDFLNITDEEVKEIHDLHLQGLVTVLRNVNLPHDMYRAWAERIGNIRYNGTSLLLKKYNVHTMLDLYKLYKRGKLDTEDAYQVETREHTIERTRTGDLYRISAEQDEQGNYRGSFGVGDVGWHSNEGSIINFTPGACLLGVKEMKDSATGFAQTVDFYHSIPDSIRSEVDEMVVVYKFQPGAINQLELEDPKFQLRIKQNFCPTDGAEVPLVITSPGGHRGLHYPKHNMWKIKGLTEDQSKDIFEMIERSILADKVVFDHWYQQDNDLVLFDNSVTLHRRVGSRPGRLAYRLQYDYKFVENYCPYDQPVFRERYYNGF